METVERILEWRCENEKFADDDQYVPTVSEREGTIGEFYIGQSLVL